MATNKQNSTQITTAEIVGGVYSADAPAPVDGQGVPLQVDATGNLKVSVAGGGSGSNVNITGINGSAPALSNPMPVELTDGSAALGTPTNPISDNIAKVGGNTVATAASGTQKVGIVGGAGTSLETTAGVLDQNIKNVGNAAVSTAASGVQKVGVVGNAGAAFDAPATGTAPANALYQGDRAATTYPTAATDGQIVAQMADKAGRQVVVQNAPRDLTDTAIVSNNSTASGVSFIAAGATGVFNDIITFIATNRSSTATVVTLTDGTKSYTFALAANGGIVVNLPTPIPASSSATAWTIGNSATVACDYIAVYAKNK